MYSLSANTCEITRRTIIVLSRVCPHWLIRIIFTNNIFIIADSDPKGAVTMSAFSVALYVVWVDLLKKPS